MVQMSVNTQVENKIVQRQETHTCYSFNHVKRTGVPGCLPAVDVPAERCWKALVGWARTGGNQAEAWAAIPTLECAASISKSPGSELYMQSVALYAVQETSPQLPQTHRMLGDWREQLEVGETPVLRAPGGKDKVNVGDISTGESLPGKGNARNSIR